MTTASPTRPVSVDELRRAWLAVQAGEFRTPTPTRRPPATTEPLAGWTPGSGERLLAVVGAAGSCGATTVALALASAADGAARVVECCSASQTGLAAASTAELGTPGPGWTRGSRERVLLDRADGVRPDPMSVPTPAPTPNPGLTVVDVGHPVEQVLAGAGWLAALLTEAPVLVIAARASVPGLRRLESCLHQLDNRNVIAAAIGPPHRRWPAALTRTLGTHTRRLLDTDRLHTVPEDRTLALHGITPAPLPSPLLTAGTALLSLTEGNPDHDH